MKRSLTSGIAFGWQRAEAIGWTPVPMVLGSPVVGSLRRVSVFAIGVSALLLAASPARAVLFGAYQFREVANTQDPRFSFIASPSINDSGEVAAIYGLDAGGVQVLTQNDFITQPTDFAFVFETTINNSGTVVFSGQTTPAIETLGFYAGSGGLITTVVDRSGSFRIDGIPIVVSSFDWDLGDNGAVVFGARLESGAAGIYQGNVAGGEITRRIEANPSEFFFQYPAVNSQGRFAVWMNFRNDAGQTTRQQIITDFGTPPIMDTNGEFDLSPVNIISPRIDMTNGNTVAFRATLDNGFEGIFTSTSGGPPTMVVDTSGPFERLSGPSINHHGNIAFFARLDAGGGEGIFRGPNPVTDKIIGIGDVFQTKSGATRTIADITGFGDDSFARYGRVAFTVRDENGVQYLVSGARPLLFDIDVDNLVQLTTLTGSNKPMMQDFTFPSFSQTELMFDYRNLTPGATLIAYINDIAVGNVVPRGAMSEFASASIPIDPIFLSGDDDLPEVLKLELVGGPGMTFQLDNIRFANFDLVNGDFSTGDLTGWEFGDGEGAAMVVGRGLEPVFVPEPSAIMLFGLGAIGTLVFRRRYRPRT